MQCRGCPAQGPAQWERRRTPSPPTVVGEIAVPHLLVCVLELPRALNPCVSVLVQVVRLICRSTTHAEAARSSPFAIVCSTMESPGMAREDGGLALSLFSEHSPPLSRKGPKQVRNRVTQATAACCSAGGAAGACQQLFSIGPSLLPLLSTARPLPASAHVKKVWEPRGQAVQTGVVGGPATGCGRRRRTPREEGRPTLPPLSLAVNTA